MNTSIECKNENGQGIWKNGLRIFERQVLVFPLLVVLLACVSFLFGGKCSAWQWWMGVLAVVGMPFARCYHWREALIAAGLFAGLLLVVKCLLPPVVWDNAACVDMSVYHLPQIQLLIEGWNPVSDPLLENIMGLLKLDYWGMAAVITAFYSKTMPVFAAVAYHFVGDPTALTIPGLVFLWLGLALATIRLFRGFVRWVALWSLTVVLPMVALQMPVDLEVAFASCGLLFAMHDALRKKTCDWLSLGVWSAWMMNLKHNGVLSAFVFCALFVIAKCWKERNEWKGWLGRFTIFGCILVSLWLIISWNPLGTSWKAYGHPIYPFMTVDENRLPSVDFSLSGNEDAISMGRMGAFAHAYISPRLTEWYFRWKLKKDDFSPYCQWWTWAEHPGTKTRLALWATFIVLFLFPRGRYWGIGGLLLLVAVPSEAVGFTRYQPWLSALGCLSIVMLAEWAEGKMSQRWTNWFTVAVIGYLMSMGGLWLWHHARNVEYKNSEMALVRDRVRPLIWLSGRGPCGNDRLTTLRDGFSSLRYNYLTCMANRTRLLLKQMGREGKTAILPTTGMKQDLEFEWIERDWPDIAGKWRRTDTNVYSEVSWKEYNVWDGMSDDSDVEAWMREPFGCYWIPVDESAAHVIEYYTVAEPREGEASARRLWRRMKYCAKAWGVTYPREVGRWLIGREVAEER